MSNIMLIDAAHSEEIRVAVSKDSKVEEFVYQSTLRKSTKGNLYLAKIVRVEPSLQAAFVEYGDDRQGFLPFSEIHPDYYQIPVDDREELLNEINASKKLKENEIDENTKSEEKLEDTDEEDFNRESDQNSAFQFYKRYKIQEVIKKDQVIIVGIAKEPRGDKGSALTTYISLAGRYCVLMPNSTRGGGISKKISDPDTRKKLRKMISEITENEGVDLIIRTAGLGRTKADFKKDYNYLTRLWNNIRDNALCSKAPCMIYEEGDVIKKAIRDLYDSSIKNIIIEGEKHYEEAKKFIKLLLPRNISKLKLHKKKIPIFTEYNVEEQLSMLHAQKLVLKSGGSIVINSTEALTAVDVNSGRATRERNIENTALKD